MKKIILLVIVFSNTLSAQDKGNFENSTNDFYNNILKESNDFNKVKKEQKKSFKLLIDNDKIPKNLNEFTIVESADPISQGNTGTCWCFSTTSFYESEILRLTKTLYRI